MSVGKGQVANKKTNWIVLANFSLQTAIKISF